MIDALKDYLTPKRFGVVAQVCLIIHFFCGLALTVVTSVLRESESGKFSCAVDKESSAVYRTYVEKTCYSRYEHTYNSPLPLYGFVLLSFGLQVFVSVIYSLVVSSRVDEINERISNGSEERTTNDEEVSHGFYVFCCYFFHLVARSVFGIVFTVLQHTVFYPSGFDFEFSCSLPSSKVTSQSAAQFNDTLITCENSTASEKELWGIIVSILNTVLALIILGEVIYLWRRFPIFNRRSEYGWSRDTEFVTVHFLRKRYTPVDVPIGIVHNNTPPQSHSTRSDRSSQDSSVGDSRLAECLEFYKQEVLHRSRTSAICYAQETDLDDVYIDVIINTGRAQHQFSKEMDRHEKYDVYMEVPQNSIRLDEIKDLFYPDEDTKGKSPRTILAVGRPGIGKTVLTEKIICDWANGVDEFYHGKIAFFFKFRWFNLEKMKDMSLKSFLRHGTGGMDEEKFEMIFDQILREPEKGIFIFDGLDEFNGEFTECVDESQILPNDPNTSMSPVTLFIRLVSGKMLPKATILVTTRPTAHEFYSEHHFDRSVEIIGFTTEKIEKYVSRFCDNTNVSDLKPKIWNHIKSSSDLLNLCYIPVNCYIVCVTLSACLSNSNNDTSALPTTMTALYQTAVDHFAKRHNRNLDKFSSEQVLKNLQKLAFDGMENGHLIFNEKYFDAQMRKSGLVNSLTNPVSPLQTQFCFIHLSIQEFLAAKHVIKALAPDEIETFISTHIKSGKWHLVLQFIAGILGDKIKMSGGDYQDCVLAFAESLTLRDGVIDLDDYRHVFVMKCLREVDVEDIVKKVCEKTPLNHATKISLEGSLLGGFAAVYFVCKHLNKVKAVHVSNLLSEDNYGLELSKLLQQRCLESLYWSRCYGGVTDAEKQQLMNAFFNSTCTLNHEHSRLLELRISVGMTDADASLVCSFIKKGNASHLQVLILSHNKFTSRGMSQLCEVLTDELCGQLMHLDFSENAIRDEGLGMLCKTLMRGHCKINKLVLHKCSLTTECVRWLSKVLCGEYCKLTDLDLANNGIGNEGVRMLCADALGKEHYKLTRLDLSFCSLTAECVRWLSDVLCDEHCKLTCLKLSGNEIGDEGVDVLCTNALRGKQCKLTELDLQCCHLSDKCLPLLCETLQSRNCMLSRLELVFNGFTQQGKRLLREVREVEICKARGLELKFSQKTDK